MADTAAALVIALSADLKDFKRQMQAATGIFDAEGRKIAKRQEDLKKKLGNWSMNFTGLGGLNKALVGLTAAGAVTGLAALVKHGLDAASAIGDVREQAGVTAEFLQQLRFAASQSGASFGDMDSALTTLNKTFGEFINTGAGKGAQTFKTLGIDKLIKAGDVKNTEQLFDAIVRKVNTFASEAQKAAFLASVFGKEAGPKLLQLVNQGTDGIARLTAQAVSLGIVLSENTVKGAKDASDKLDALFNVMKAQGVAAVASLAPEIAHLAEQITQGLPDLITWVEKWAAYFNLIDLSPVQKLKIQIQEVEKQISSANSLKDSAFLNPLGIMSANIDQTKAGLISKLKGLQRDLGKAVTAEAAAPKPAPAPARGGPLQINDIAGEQAAAQAAAKAEQLRQRREQFLQQTVVDAATANAAMIAAQNETSVQLLKGSAQYYQAVKKQIDDEYQSEVAVIEARSAKQKLELEKQGTDWAGYADAVRNIDAQLTADLVTASEKRKQQLDETGPDALVREALAAGKEQIQLYADEAAQIGLTAGALAKLLFLQQAQAEVRRKNLTLTKEQTEALAAEAEAIGQAAQKADDQRRTMSDSIQVADEFRQGLGNVFTAGLHGFDAMGDAAVRFLEQIAELIFQLYVVKPLIEDVFGQSGTGFGAGGGSGSAGIISSILNLFGDGGVMTPQGPRQLKRFAGGGRSSTAAIFGEAGPEAAVPLPDGRRIPVELRLPAVARAMGGGGGSIYFDLRGAVMTQDLLDQMNAISKRNANAEAQAVVGQYDRNMIPGRVRQLNRDPRRSY